MVKNSITKECRYIFMIWSRVGILLCDFYIYIILIKREWLDWEVCFCDFMIRQSCVHKYIYHIINYYFYNQSLIKPNNFNLASVPSIRLICCFLTCRFTASFGIKTTASNFINNFVPTSCIIFILIRIPFCFYIYLADPCFKTKTWV